MCQSDTIATFPAEEILAKVGEQNTLEVDFAGGKTGVRLSSLRLKTFKRSTQCVRCGRIGNIIGLDLPKGHQKPHLNLYCNNPNKGDSMVLMTKDHIVPKSRGGKNHISNMQTMCCHCNAAKADKSPEEYTEYLKSVNNQKVLTSV